MPTSSEYGATPKPPPAERDTAAFKRGQADALFNWPSSVQCLHCRSTWRAGVIFCLDNRCARPIGQEGRQMLLSTFKPGAQNAFLQNIDAVREKVRAKNKHQKKHSRQNYKRRINKAIDEGFLGHAHRMDQDLTYYSQMQKSGIKRELIAQKHSEATGEPEGEPYSMEKEYLDANPWEESHVYKILMLQKDTTRTMTPRGERRRGVRR